MLIGNATDGFMPRKLNLTQNQRNRTRKRAVVRVFSRSDGSDTATVRYNNVSFRAALGPGGVRARKFEGDGATPRGFWRATRVYYRPDRMKRPMTALPTLPLSADFGWCDSPGDRNYNRPVRLPYGASAERLWRADHLYDAIIVLDYNMSQRTQGRGSAIFVHAARDGFAPTAGCIALKREHLLRLIAMLPRGTVFATGRNLVFASLAGRGRFPR
jgi:L,D-peptidoglycan transpeptidase YkuD (ErfK/YbiS/YcfS/YnhG family)